MRKREYYTKAYLTESGADRLTPRLGKVLQLFSQHKPNRVLDIGCGDGRFSLLLKDACQAREMYGVEISPQAVKSANEVGVRAFQVDVDEDRFPFQDGYFDAIFCGEVIEHLFDPDHLLDEIYRTLNPTGFSIITTPNLAAWFNRLILLFGFQPYELDASARHYVGRAKSFGESGGGHIRTMTYKALKGLLGLHGFRIVRVAGTCRYHAGRISRLLELAEKVMSLYPPLSSTLVFVVRKC